MPVAQAITFDNDTELARHAHLRQHGIDTFFCATHAPWQKGGIENAIGRTRRPLPRKTDLAQIDDRQLQLYLLAYNTTERKCLEWNAPADAFCNQLLRFKRGFTVPSARK